MPSILIHLFPAILSAVLYAGLGFAYQRQSGKALARQSVGPLALLMLALILHGCALYQHLFIAGGMRFGFAEALSLMLWLAVMLYFFEGFFAPIKGLQALIMPIAAVCALLPVFVPGQHVLQHVAAPGFRFHFLIAMLAYSLFTLAALHALVMTVVERRLHAGKSIHGLPPLLAMEAILFRLIGLAFVFLTLTLGSGILFSEQIFGKPLTWNHKTVFAFASWAVFGILLLGRKLRGWRGKIALRWTLVGFVCLLLAYVGTRFVLEVLLGRT